MCILYQPHESKRVIHKCKKYQAVFSPNKKLMSRFNHKNAKIKIKSDFHFKPYCVHEISENVFNRILG